MKKYKRKLFITIQKSQYIFFDIYFTYLFLFINKLYRIISEKCTTKKCILANWYQFCEIKNRERGTFSNKPYWKFSLPNKDILEGVIRKTGPGSVVTRINALYLKCSQACGRCSRPSSHG